MSPDHSPAPKSSSVRVRPADELDLDAITTIDERITGQYRPDNWERRLTYYLRRDPLSPLVAELDGRVVGFMLGELRAGEFGFDDTTGWVEVLGVDPDCRGLGVGQKLADGMFEHFRNSGAVAVRTLVDTERGDLLQFFSRVGFEPAPLSALFKRL